MREVIIIIYYYYYYYFISFHFISFHFISFLFFSFLFFSFLFFSFLFFSFLFFSFLFFSFLFFSFLFFSFLSFLFFSFLFISFLYKFAINFCVKSNSQGFAYWQILKTGRPFVIFVISTLLYPYHEESVCNVLINDNQILLGIFLGKHRIFVILPYDFCLNVTWYMVNWLKATCNWEDYFVVLSVKRSNFHYKTIKKHLYAGVFSCLQLWNSQCSY